MRHPLPLSLALAASLLLVLASCEEDHNTKSTTTAHSSTTAKAASPKPKPAKHEAAAPATQPDENAPQLIATGSVPGDATDQSGLTDTVGGLPHNTLGSFGSAIDYTGKDDLYLAVDDRGPADGDSNFKDRFHHLKIVIDPATKSASITCVKTTLLTNESGQTLTGSFNAFDATNSDKGLRYDPEGIRILKDGNLLISDEYGPFIHIFSPEGKRLKAINVPDAFKITKPDPDKKVETKQNTSGRVTNKGFEGLALSPDQSKAYAILQAPLIQDAGKKGKFVRILEVDLNSGATRQFALHRPDIDAEYNEILALDDHRFLVIERDDTFGASAKRKTIATLDITGASDVSSIPDLQHAPADSFKPIHTKLFIDLLNPAYGLRSDTFPEKVEGLTFGPTLPDGRKTLIVTTDNDLQKTQPTRVWVFAVKP